MVVPAESEYSSVPLKEAGIRLTGIRDRATADPDSL
jgi:hypothetical protein